MMKIAFSALVFLTMSADKLAALDLPPGVIFEPSTLVNVEVNATSITLISGDIFEYSYCVISKSDSKQNVYHATLELAEYPINPVAPQGWIPPDQNFYMIDKGRKGETGVKVYGWLSDDELGDFDIKPGQSLCGFGFKSKDLPGIKLYFVQGFSKEEFPRMVHGGEPGPDEEEAFNEWYDKTVDFFVNSVSSKTVLPEVVKDQTPTALIERLASLKHQSAALGWIYGPGMDGIVKSLNAKLDAAKESIGKGNNKTAQNQLKAFINELEAQRDKHINDNAYYLLKINAEFVINKLD